MKRDEVSAKILWQADTYVAKTHCLKFSLVSYFKTTYYQSLPLIILLLIPTINYATMHNDVYK